LTKKPYSLPLGTYFLGIGFALFSGVAIGSAKSDDIAFAKCLTTLQNGGNLLNQADGRLRDVGFVRSLYGEDRTGLLCVPTCLFNLLSAEQQHRGIRFNGFDPKDPVSSFETFLNDSPVGFTLGVHMDDFVPMLRNVMGKTPEADLRPGGIFERTLFKESDLEVPHRRMILSIQAHAFLVKSVDPSTKEMVLIDPHHERREVKTTYGKTDDGIELTGPIKEHWRRFRRGLSSRAIWIGSMVFLEPRKSTREITHGVPLKDLKGQFVEVVGPDHQRWRTYVFDVVWDRKTRSHYLIAEDPMERAKYRSAPNYYVLEELDSVTPFVPKTAAEITGGISLETLEGKEVLLQYVPKGFSDRRSRIFTHVDKVQGSSLKGYTYEIISGEDVFRLEDLESITLAGK
jgi:hypothetical protein